MFEYENKKLRVQKHIYLILYKTTTIIIILIIKNNKLDYGSFKTKDIES